MTLNDYVPLIFRRLRPQSRPREAASLITGLAKAYGLENIGEIDEQFLNGFTCASDIVIAQLEKEFESGNKGEWIDNGNGSYTCSNCKTEWTTSQIEKMCFCPTCGNSKVRGDTEKERIFNSFMSGIAEGVAEARGRR